jgi:HAD superfamily hydrolase (TIGR01509 family)
MTDELREYTVKNAWDKVLMFLYDRFEGLPSPREFLDETLELKREMMDKNGPALLPGAREVLSSLSRSYSLAIVTGSFKMEAERLLAHMNAAGHVKCIIGGDDVNFHKPNPECYLRAAEALGCSPHRCLAVEDSPIGIAAGVAAGTAVVAVKAGNRYGFNQAGAPYRIDSLLDLTEEKIESIWKDWNPGTLLQGD